MLSNLSNTLKKYVNGWLVLVLSVLTGYFQFVIFLGQSAKIQAASGGVGPIDLLLFYTPTKVYGMVASYGEEIRASYRLFELTYDIAYPIVYTLLFALANTWLFQRGFASASNMHNYNVVPFGALAADLFENLSIVGMLSAFPSTPVWLAWASTIFTLAKWIFVFTSTGLLLYGFVKAAVNGFKKQK